MYFKQPVFSLKIPIIFIFIIITCKYIIIHLRACALINVYLKIKF